MLHALRVLVLVTSFLLMATATWAEIELVNNQFLQAWLDQRGLWWLSYAPLLLVIVGFTTYAHALLRWPRIIETVPLLSRDLNGSVNRTQDVRVDDKGRPFVAHDDDGPEAHAQPGNLALPTGGQGPSINSLSGPGGSAAVGSSTTASKGGPVVVNPATGAPQSEITVPPESPLVAYALGVDKKYRLVEQEPGTPTLQRVRGALERRKGADDRGLTIVIRRCSSCGKASEDVEG